MNGYLKRAIVKNLRNNPSARAARELFVNLQTAFESPYSMLNALLAEYEIENVIDVGANVGQFGIDLRRKGYQGAINSFEPVKRIFELLQKNAARYEPWKAWNMALGEMEASMEINVSGNDGLSTSFLTMKQLHIENFPKSLYERTEVVKVSTLDIQLPKLQIDPRKLLLKLDVQGFESAVIRGAGEFLAQIPFCFFEVSLQPLYESEDTLLPLLNLLNIFDHQVIDVFRGVKGKNGRLLQLDVLTKSTTFTI